MRKQACLIVALAVLASASASATVIRVDMYGGGDYLTIQEGLDAAAEGDTVLVAPGWYSGELNRGLDFYGRNIVLVSEVGASQTVIDCQSVDRGINFYSGEDSSCVVDGFRITGGNAMRGGGMNCDNASSPTIRNCYFRANAAEVGGGGLRCTGGSSPSLSNVTFSANWSRYGGGMIARDGSSPTLTNVAFKNNSAEGGGGMKCEGSLAVLTEVLFSENVSSISGGGFHSDLSASPTLSYVTFLNNEAPMGGGMSCHNATATLDHCTFAGNSAYDGGAIMAEVGSTPQISTSVLSFSPDGGAVGCEAGSLPTLSRCVVYGNAPSDSLCGGHYDNLFSDPLFCDLPFDDVSVDYSSPCLPYNNPWGEQIGAKGWGCGARVWYVLPDGSGDAPTIQAAVDSCATDEAVVVAPGTYKGVGNRGIDFAGKCIEVRSEQGADATFMDCEYQARGFHFHTGEDSSAVVDGFTIMHATADSGGAFLVDGSSPTISGCTITECYAQYGGGMCCLRDAAPTIEHTTFSDNQAMFGGGVYCEWGGSPRIAHSLISSNHASESGGGVWALLSGPVLYETTIEGNSADGSGGGMGCFTNCNPLVRFCTLTDNVAGERGGGIYLDTSGGWLENVTLFGNSAGDGAGGVHCFASSPTLAGVIISFSTSGEGIFCGDGSQPYLRHCDVFGNAGGDSLCGVSGGNNISDDPLFCDIWEHDFSLCANSLCLDPLAPAGHIGHHGSGCDECGGTSVDGAPGHASRPLRLAVENQPNPFWPQTTVRFSLPQACSDVHLTVYNLRGQKVRTLFRGAASFGTHTVVWNGADDRGTPVSSGVYFYTLIAGDERARGRMVLLR